MLLLIFRKKVKIIPLILKISRIYIRFYFTSKIIYTVNIVYNFVPNPNRSPLWHRTLLLNCHVGKYQPIFYRPMLIYLTQYPTTLWVLPFSLSIFVSLPKSTPANQTFIPQPRHFFSSLQIW